MKTDQEYKLDDLRKFLPERAQISVRQKKGQTGTSLEISVKIVPYLSHSEHDETIKNIIDFYGEDLLEVYTETTGYHFYVYLRMSATQPTTVTL